MSTYCIIINRKFSRFVETSLRGVEYISDEGVQISEFVYTKKKAREFLKQLLQIGYHPKDFYQIVEIHFVNDRFCRCKFCRKNIFIPKQTHRNYIFLKT